MPLTRRRFVQRVGIGAVAALTDQFISARGRENLVRSAFDPSLQAIQPGMIILSSNENPMGPGKAVIDAARAAFGPSGTELGRYSPSASDLIDAICHKFKVKPENVMLG